MANMNTFKDKVHQHFLKLLDDKISVIQQKLDDLQESLKNETKSTAGDKHETARAFVHIEQENTGRQLEVLLQQKAELQSFSAINIHDTIVPGALVKTDRGWLYISASIGKAAIDSETVFALSPQSPLGKKLIGCKVGGSVEINGIKYTVADSI
jgi:transcription elongation GreA/GreB family factor